MASTTTNTNGTTNMLTVKVKYESTGLSVQSPKTGVWIKIRTDNVSCEKMSAEELALIYALEEDSPPNREFSVPMSASDLKTLFAVFSRQGGTLPTVVAPAPVVAPPAPVVAPPAPVGPIKPVNGVLPITVRDDKSMDLVGRYNEREAQKEARGLDADERRLDALEKGVASLTGQDFWHVEYDIPEVLDKVCPNPSKWMWRRAFRATRSGWVMSAKQYESAEVQEFIAGYREKGCTVYTMKYARDQVEKIKESAQESLAKELREKHDSLIKKIDNADKALVEALELSQTNKEERSAEQKRMNTLRAALREASDALDRSIKCAELYDDTGSSKDLILALREATRSAAISFNARARALYLKQVVVPS